ncbi:hypothetical protein BGZ83_007510 [Gryganskiella cystojenkinii]|nr:hypothetical protein BGZ83_007510 [Gryganskiella cystojenkinii]
MSFTIDLFDDNLLKSADSLENALASYGKLASGPVDQNLFSPVSSVSNGGNGFDEFLASDFQFGLLSSDESPALSLSSSPFTAMDDSPVLGFDSYGSSAIGASLFDFPVQSEVVSSVPSTPILNNKSRPVLTTAAVQQAAAALNIPWSHDLELAVMAQAANHSTSVLPALNMPAPVVVPKVESVESIAANKKRAISPEEEPDEIVAKRAKNTDAARRSRLKKLVKLETLETKVSELESTNTRLTMKVAVLETEKNGHLVKEAEQSVRIAQLEAKLAEAHAALTSRA